MLVRCAAFVTLLLSVSALADNPALIRVGDLWKHLPGLSEPPGPADGWQRVGLDDSLWLAGRSSFGPSEATVLPSSPVPYHSVYFRRSFELDDVAQVKWLTLRIDYCDGFVAYLNGREIARRNVEGVTGTPVPFDRLATNFHFRGAPEEILVTPFTDSLTSGTNVLAVQLHGAQPTYAGLCFSAELLANFNRAPHLQNMSSNQVQIIWKTPVPSDTRVSFGLDSNFGTEYNDANLVTTHVATLTNLVPDTVYHYQVVSSGDGETAVSAPATIRTFKPAGSLNFIAFGDAGWNSIPQYEIADVIRKANPDFAIEAGDIVYPSFTGALADPRVFSIYQEHMADTPYFFGLGNHDLLTGVGHYLQAFYLPTNSVSLADHAIALTSPEHYYSFDHGDAHLTVLFVPFIHQYKLTVGDPQYQWLVNDLASSRKPWKIVIWHVPMHSSSLHRFDDLNVNGIFDSVEIRDVLLPVLSRYGVQLVLSGHEHGYERFNPIGGVHSITTAGGGVTLYGFTESDFASALYWSRYNCLKVTIDGDRLEAEALGTDGSVFDRMTIQRGLPASGIHQAEWHSPRIESADGQPSAQPESGHSFDFRGEPLPTVSGQFSNLGRTWVNNDRTHLYVGLEQLMIYDNNNVFLFLESSGMEGTTNLMSVGNGIVDPAGQGADGLDFLSNLSFTNFAPSVGCILGDIHADGQFRSFARTNFALNIGQGVFMLNSELSDAPGARIQQFHLSSLVAGPRGRDNAQFIKVAIPYSTLGGLKPGDLIRMGAIVGGPAFDLESQYRFLDSGFLGRNFSGYGLTPAILEGVEVKLADDPDPDDDGDGLGRRDELALGTDPNRADSDGDGLPDGWEVANGLSPLIGVAENGADGDPDNDGITNLNEFLAGTQPRNPDSALRLTFELSTPQKFGISWPAMAGRKYHLQSSDGSLTDFRNMVEPDFPISEVSTRLSYEFNIHTVGKGCRFFRIRVAPP